MIIKNITNHPQSFTVGKNVYKLAAAGMHGDTMKLSSELEDSPVIDFMFRMNHIAEISGDEMRKHNSDTINSVQEKKHKDGLETMKKYLSSDSPVEHNAEFIPTPVFDNPNAPSPILNPVTTMPKNEPPKVPTEHAAPDVARPVGEATIPVQCCAHTASGEQCRRSKLFAPEELPADGKPMLWFCNSHKNENPDDYVYTEENGWVKRS